MKCLVCSLSPSTRMQTPQRQGLLFSFTAGYITSLRTVPGTESKQQIFTKQIACAKHHVKVLPTTETWLVSELCPVSKVDIQAWFDLVSQSAGHLGLHQSTPVCLFASEINCFSGQTIPKVLSTLMFCVSPMTSFFLTVRTFMPFSYWEENLSSR